MNPFLTAFLIVSGIIAPFGLIALLIFLLNETHIALVAKRLSLEAKLASIKKQPPYDDIELSQPPNKEMFTIRLIKNEEVVYEGHHDKF